MRASAPSNLARRRCLTGVPLLAVGLFVRPALADPAVQHASRRLLGTQVDIVAQGAMPGAAAPAIDAAFAEMARLERLMSRYRPDSQVSALARAAGRNPVPVAPELMAILKLATRLSARSGGLRYHRRRVLRLEFRSGPGGSRAAPSLCTSSGW